MEDRGPTLKEQATGIPRAFKPFWEKSLPGYTDGADGQLYRSRDGTLPWLHAWRGPGVFLLETPTKGLQAQQQGQQEFINSAAMQRQLLV